MRRQKMPTYLQSSFHVPRYRAFGIRAVVGTRAKCHALPISRHKEGVLVEEEERRRSKPDKQRLQLVNRNVEDMLRLVFIGDVTR